MSTENIRNTEDDIEEAEEPGFSVNSLELADWALRRIAAHKAKIAENERVAEANIAWEKMRLAKLNNAPTKSIEFLTGHLKLFAEFSREALLGGGKKKSRALSHGSIGWRTKPAGLEVKDPAALLEWAKRARLDMVMVRVKEEPAMSPIKEHFKRTGEVPDGCEAVPEQEVFEVKTLGGSDDN